jgi:hypothetical protein
MENALHAARGAGSQPDGHRVELTVSGWLAIVLAIAGMTIGVCGAYQHYAPASPARVPPVAQHQQPMSLQESAPQAGPSGATTPSVAQLTQALVKERREHEIQIAAWRAMNEFTRQQIASLRLNLQGLDEKIDAIQKMPPPAVHAVHPGIADATSSAKALHTTLDTAKAMADIDVTSLPVETVSAQSLNVTGFGNGVVQIGDQKLTVGQAYQPGETIVAVDPDSRSIVTNRRIINVSN